MAIDWQHELAQFLIAGGINGRKKTEIIIRLQRFANASTITAELEALQGQNKVQRFLIPPKKGGSGRRVEIWRATTKILERRK